MTKPLEQLFKLYPLYSALFPQQLEVVLHPSKFKAVQCSRRAGKSNGLVVNLFQDALNNPNSLSLYLALTNESVKKIVFPIVREVIDKFKMDVEVIADEIRFKNGSVICVLGANHTNKIESFRGTKLLNCVVDEAASFDEHILQRLLDLIIIPALTDLDGTLILAGTPAPHCSGIFYKATTGQEDGWYVKKWTGFDNPFVRDNQIVRAKQYLLRKKVDETDPGYRREFLGEWCADTDLLMIKPFTVERLPVSYDTENWRAIIGVDFGFNDKTAFTVVGWRKHNPKAYIIESYGVSGMGVSEISHHLRRLYNTYKPNRIVGDPAGASLIIMKEFADKHGIFLSKAEKAEKAHYVGILNDALINAELVLCPDDTKELQEEFKKVVWNEQRTREHDSQECDCLDSALYAFRDSIAYTEKIPVPKVYNDETLAAEMFAQRVKQVQEKNQKQIWDADLDTDLLYDIQY